MRSATKHVLVYLAALVVLWLAGLLPFLICRPGIYGGMTPLQMMSQLRDIQPQMLLPAIPILLVLAVLQWVVFASAPKRPVLVYLGAIALIWSTFAWVWMWFVYFSGFGG